MNEIIEPVAMLTKTRLAILKELARGFMFIVLNPEAKHIGVALVGWWWVYSITFIWLSSRILSAINSSISCHIGESGFNSILDKEFSL